MSDRRIPNIYSVVALVTGLIFIVSAVAKSAASDYFASVIESYNVHIPALSPAIILIEALMGSALLFRIRERWTAAIAACMIIVFTGVYLYGYIYMGVVDCGCFGRLNILSTNPYVVVGKNVVLLAMLVYLFVKGSNRSRLTVAKVAVAAVVVGVVAFLTGHSYEEHRIYGKVVSIPLHESPLASFVDVSPDSTYFVFVFSYGCPYCMNSIANLKEFGNSPYVDHVIGLAYGDAERQKWFEERFDPNFELHTHQSEIFEVSESFPRGYYIHNDTIKMQTKGELTCELILTELLSQFHQPRR